MGHRILLAALLTRLVCPGQIPDFKPSTPLLAAVLKSDTQATKKLLDEGADPNEGRFFGMSALMLAIINSNQPAVRALLDRGADPRATDRNGSTTLMWAVGSESPDPSLVQELLKRGVDPNAQNKLGESALTWASRRGNVSLVERLKAGEHRMRMQSANRLRMRLQSCRKAVPICESLGLRICHHQSLPQMAYAAARERGFRVDAAVSEQQVEAVVAMIKTFREPVEKGTVNLPNPGISVSYTLLGLAAEGYAPDDLTTAMTLAITRTQLPDSSFAVFPGRPPLEASRFTSTALSLRALQLFGRGCGDKIDKAREWLMQAQPDSQEDRTMKLFGLVWSKADRKEIEKASVELIAQQRPDGGWAQLAGVESDAYATGQAMVALHQAGSIAAKDQAFQRGVAYLLRTQMADGSWIVRTRSSPVQTLKDSGFPHGRHQWISAAGTSWAAIALTLSQPKTATHTAGGLF